MAGLAAAVLAAVTIGIVVTAGGSSAGAQQLTSTQHACQQWTGTYAPSLGGAPAGGWCTAMTDWMRQQLRGGHMTGAMMWGDATAMRDTCRTWMSTGPAAAGVSPRACNDMVAWMASHADNWGSWMMGGRVMGQGP